MSKKIMLVVLILLVLVSVMFFGYIEDETNNNYEINWDGGDGDINLTYQEAYDASNLLINQTLFVDGLGYPELILVDNNIDTRFLDLNIVELTGKDYDLKFYLDENNNWKELEDEKQ